MHMKHSHTILEILFGSERSPRSAVVVCVYVSHTVSLSICPHYALKLFNLPRVSQESPKSQSAKSQSAKSQSAKSQSVKSQSVKSQSAKSQSAKSQPRVSQPRFSQPRVSQPSVSQESVSQDSVRQESAKSLQRNPKELPKEPPKNPQRTPEIIPFGAKALVVLVIKGLLNTNPSEPKA